MTQPSHPQAAYKRRDVPGQELFDFGAEAAPAPEPQARPRAPVLLLPPEMPRLAPPPIPAELQKLADESQPDVPAYLTDARVIELIGQAARTQRGGEIYAVKVRFKPFRATLYSFVLRGRLAHVKFHLAFRRAPEAAVLQAAQLMFCRSSKMRRALPREEYDRFVRSLKHLDFKLPGARKATKRASGSRGVHRELVESFQRVNAAYFSGQLKQPELCWSPARARRILGSYQERCDRLIVSQVFDSPNVPLFVLDFLMYHELLHKFLGIGRRRDGKRCMHGEEFKRLEKKFERFDDAQAFLKRL